MFFFFCLQIKYWLSVLEVAKCLSEQQTGKTLVRLLHRSLIWICAVCLGCFGKQLVLEILEHFTVCSQWGREWASFSIEIFAGLGFFFPIFDRNLQFTVKHACFRKLCKSYASKNKHCLQVLSHSMFYHLRLRKYFQTLNGYYGKQ